jgi:hypothetical protein
MVVNRLQNGLMESCIAPRASRLNCQNILDLTIVVGFFIFIFLYFCDTCDTLLFSQYKSLSELLKKSMSSNLKKKNILTV